MANPTSTVELLDLVRKSGVLGDDVLKRLENGPSLPETPGKLAAALVKQGLLTTFQARLLLAGKHRGFKLGSYVVRDQIGQGGMGAVYLAEHESLKRKVALKVLTADKDPLAIKRFAREARAVAALDHPNIVRLFDVAKHGEVHYLVMEYVDGQTMEQMVASAGRLPYPQVAGWASQIALGLQQAHEKGFVHRDIKPANLMVCKSGQAKLLDMGLARSGEAGDKLTEMMDKGAVVGTADYISPEQAISGSCDIRADIYALGATIYTLASGRPPFEGTTSQKLIAHQMKTPTSLADLVDGFPQELADIVEKMMAKKPDDRFQTPEEVAEALAPWACLDGAGRMASPASGVRLGANSSVDLGAPVSGGIVAGSSTKRLANPSSKTTPTPITAVARATPKSAVAKPAAAPSTGRVAKVKAKPASGKAKRREGKKGPPAWVMFAASGVSGFIIVAVVALVAVGSTKKPQQFQVAPATQQTTATVTPAPKPQPTAPKPASTPKPAASKPADPKSTTQTAAGSVDLNPSTDGQDVKALAAAARQSAEQGNWLDSAAKYVVITRTDPDNYEHWLMAVTLLAQARDDSGYRQFRREMLDKYRADPDARVRERVSKACLILPGTREEMTTCGQMAESALAEREPTFSSYPLYQLNVALSEYRQGRFDAADQRAAQFTPDAKPNVTRTGFGLAIRALAQFKAGRSDEAKKTLTELNFQMRQLAPNGITSQGVSWQDWMLVQVLTREAEALAAPGASN